MSADQDQHVKIERDELFTRSVDEALEKEKALRRRIGGDPPPISPLRRLLMSSMFYLPIAALLGTLGAYAILEPHFNDIQVLGGEVKLVDNDPFALPDGFRTITVGDKEVVLLEETKLEKGASGEEPLGSLAEIEEGQYLEVAVTVEEMLDSRMFAVAVRPASEEHALATGTDVSGSSGWVLFLFFPLIATFVAIALHVAEGVSSRNWTRMVERAFLGGLLGGVFSMVASFIPGGIIMMVGQLVLDGDEGTGFTISDVSPGRLLAYIAFRGAAWAAVGAALGVGMNLIRGTKPQIRNSVLGGALGGALGGTLFDPIDRFFRSSMFADSSVSRLVGFLILGVSIGIFVALVERLAREAWIRVRTGPLAGKSFILYKTPTTIGSSPQCDIYLFKDAEIDPSHAQIHRVGQAFELEDMNSRMGTKIAGTAVRRRRLASGDQIVLGGTVLEFEERAKRA